MFALVEELRYVKDVSNGKIHEFWTENSVRDFFEGFENPANLVEIDVWYSDGSGWSGKRCGFAFGKSGSIKVQWLEYNWTNNYAEYHALYVACLNAALNDHVRLDSKLCVNQVLGHYKIRTPSLKEICHSVRRIVKQKKLTLEWVPRLKNLAGLEIDRVKGAK